MIILDIGCLHFKAKNVYHATSMLEHLSEMEEVDYNGKTPEKWGLSELSIRIKTDKPEPISPEPETPAENTTTT